MNEIVKDDKIPVTAFPKPAYTKKQKKLIRYVLNDLLSNVKGFLYTDPKEIGVFQTFLVDDKNKEEIIKKYENTSITTKHD